MLLFFCPSLSSGGFVRGGTEIQPETGGNGVVFQARASAWDWPRFGLALTSFFLKHPGESKISVVVGKDPQSLPGPAVW